MRLSTEEAQQRFSMAVVARLATADAHGRPHVVPVTFAVADHRVLIAVDHKPKGTTDLKRLRNIHANAQVSLLVDHYEDDWQRLWWVRADGRGRVTEAPESRGEAVGLLCAKYRPYVTQPPHGPVIEVTVTDWVGWAYTE